MLNHFQTSDQGLIDNRPCELRKNAQYPRIVACPDPYHLLALLEEVAEAGLPEWKKTEERYQIATGFLAEDVLEVISDLEDDRNPDDLIEKLRAIEKTLDRLALGEFL